MPKVRADRDLGSGTGSMIETLQVKNGQVPSFLNVLQGVRTERNFYFAMIYGTVVYRSAVAEPLDVKPRRHDVPTRGRFPIPGLLSGFGKTGISCYRCSWWWCAGPGWAE